MKPNTRPRRGLGVAVFGIGLVFALGLVVLGITSISRRADALAELPLSGGTIPSDVRGDVTIFARVDGSPNTIPSPNVRAAVVDSDGNGLELKPYTSTSTFSSLSGKSGIAEWSVTIPDEGDFELVAESADENVTGWLIGEPPFSAGGLFAPILGGVLVGFLGFVLGLLIFFGAMFKKEIEPGAPGYVPQPSPGQYPQQPGQYAQQPGQYQQPAPGQYPQQHGQYQQPAPGQYPQQPQPIPQNPVEQPPTQLPPPPPPYPSDG